jgi:DNA adenine methylase
MRPPFLYFGGKMTIAERIVALLPAHTHYVEPYAGSLAVLLAKPPVPMETANDLDGRLVTFWRVLRDHPAELIRRCALTPHARAEYQTCRSNPVVPGDDVETARRVWTILSQGRGGTLCGRKTGWKHYVDPSGSGVGMPGYLDAYVDRMAPVVERLHRVSLESMPALDVIAKYGAHRDTLLYIDPPYLGAARSHNGREYEHEMRSPDEHRALAEALHAARAAVVLSGYHSPLYDKLYAGWDRVSLPSATGNASLGTQARIEVLWSNRPLGVQPSLFDAAVA